MDPGKSPSRERRNEIVIWNEKHKIRNALNKASFIEFVEGEKMEMGTDVKSLLLSTGIKKDKHLNELTPQIDDFLGLEDEGQAVLELQKLFKIFQRTFLMGSEEKYWNFVEVLKSNQIIEKKFGAISVVHSRLDSKMMAGQKDPVAFLESWVNFLLITSRFVSDGFEFRKITPTTEFAVIKEGSNTKQKIFAGQHLIGGASILFGTASQFRNVGADTRGAFFTVTDVEWQFAIPLEPDKTADADKAAVRGNSIAKSLQSDVGSNAGAEKTKTGGESSIAGEISKLAELLDKGLIDEQEFQEAKRKLLG